MSGGPDELSGNGFDTDNNVDDFVTRSPQPQNSASKIEPDIVPAHVCIRLSPGCQSL